MLATSTVHSSPPKPAWYTEELDEEWIEPDITASPLPNTSESPSSRNAGTVVSRVDFGDDSRRNTESFKSATSTSAPQGTFVVREDQQPAPILPFPAGRNKARNLLKDFFSPLALETMFEPPSPRSTPQEPDNVPEPQPQLLDEVPPETIDDNQEHSRSHEELGEAAMDEETRPFGGEQPVEDEEPEAEDVIIASDIPNLASFDGRKPSSAFKFTFGLYPGTVSADLTAPATSHTPKSNPLPTQAPATDSRLRLFHFQYDTFTREHLSALVDSIVVHTPSNSNPGTLTPGHAANRSSIDEAFLRANKRLRLTPPNDLSLRDLPLRTKPKRDYIGESRNLMKKIRQARTLSMNTISSKENIEPTSVVDQSTLDTSSRRVPTADLQSMWFTDTAESSAKEGSPVPSSSLNPSSAHASSSLHPIYPNSTINPSVPSSLFSSISNSNSRPPSRTSALGYRRQAADLMAQIRKDMTAGKRIFSLESTKSLDDDEAQQASLTPAKSTIQPGSRNTPSALLDPNDVLPRKIPGKSPRKLLRRLSAADEVDRELAVNQSVSETSLQDIAAQNAPSNPPKNITLVPPVVVTLAVSEPIQVFHANIPTPFRALRAPSPAGSRVVSSGTSASVETSDSAMTRGTTATSATSVITARSSSSGSLESAPSFVKHPGPVQMTRITPQDMPALPETVGGMRFDRDLLRWVKVVPSKERENNTQDGGLTVVSEESDDPFRDFESLHSGGTGGTGTGRHSIGQSQLRITSGGSVTDDDTSGDEQPAHSVAVQAADSDTDDSFDFVADSGIGIVDVMTGVPSIEDSDVDTTDTENENMDADQGVPDSATEEEDEPTTTPPGPSSNSATAAFSTPSPINRSLPAPRSALKNGNTSLMAATPASALKTPRNSLEHGHRRSVSFSDGRREGKIYGLGKHGRDDDGPSALLPVVPGGKVVSILDDLDDPSFEVTPSKTGSSSSGAHGEIQSLPEAHFMRRSFMRSTKERDLSFAAGNQTFLTDCSFGVSREKLVHIITDVHPYMPHWDALGEIDLSNKGIESTARLKEFLPKLATLNLDKNELPWVTGVPNCVRTLSVASNQLTAMTSFNHLLNLEVLDISNNQIDSLQQLSCLRHLRELKADGNTITSLEGLNGLHNLSKLSLKGNQLGQINFEEMEWSRMELLNLSGNQIREITGLSSLKSLCAINLDHNQLTSIQASHTMPKLRTLRISSNRLSRLDAGSFVNVRTLYADNNILTNIQGARKLRRLENISLRNQGGAGLSLTAHDIRDVKRLYISGNPLTRDFLNESCYNLVYLELAACRLSGLPNNLAQLIPNVRVLNLNYNFLTDVSALDGLTRLRKLTLIGSRLKGTKSLVRMLRRMPEIEMLDFRMNPCTLGWYLPILVQDVPGALQPSEDAHWAHHKKDIGEGRPGPRTINGGGASSPSYSASWQELDAKFRCDLPDEAYVGRLAYRGLVMRACPRIKMLDGVVVASGERDKAERLLEGVLSAKQR